MEQLLSIFEEKVLLASDMSAAVATTATSTLPKAGSLYYDYLRKHVPVGALMEVDLIDQPADEVEYAKAHFILKKVGDDSWTGLAPHALLQHPPLPPKFVVAVQ